MTRPRRKAFRPVGAVSPQALGISGRRERELRLSVAWTRVAGPTIAARAAPGSLRRGELTITLGDPAWAETLDELLPTLLARLRRAAPELGIERGRLLVAGEAQAREARRPASSGLPLPGEEEARRPAAPADGPVDEARLERVMERYLRRAAQKP